MIRKSIMTIYNLVVEGSVGLETIQCSTPEDLVTWISYWQEGGKNKVVGMYISNVSGDKRTPREKISSLLESLKE